MIALPNGDKFIDLSLSTSMLAEGRHYEPELIRVDPFLLLHVGTLIDELQLIIRLFLTASGGNRVLHTAIRNNTLESND